MYGDIAYAKSWCGFFNPGVISGAYCDWREQLKAYMRARNIDLGHLTEAEVEAINVFTRTVPLVKVRVTPIKQNHHPDEVVEVTRHMRMLGKDSVRKLQISKVCRIAERTGSRDVAESLSQ